tara:strand:+ start:1158 stop:2822 length:1665 start_codon:yes stop_codon:yes gene_type:complete
MDENKGLLDLRTIQAWKDVNKTPWTAGLLDDNQTITGQEFSDNPIIGGVQKFNKGLLANTLGTGEQAFNYLMATGLTPFAFLGDSAEGIYEMLPENVQGDLSALMYNSRGMDAEDFGDHVEGHLLEGLLANPTLSGFVNKGRIKKNKNTVNEAIKYNLDDTKGLFLDKNIPENIKSGIIYEYDWYTKSKKWEGDKSQNLWHGVKVDKDKQALLENKIKEKIIQKEIIISEGKTYPEKTMIKARLDDLDLKDLNKVRIEQGLEPLKQRTVFIDKDGNQINAKFVAGTIDGSEVALSSNEIKRVSYILSDGIRTSHRRFDENPNVMGLVDKNVKLDLGMRMDSKRMPPYSIAEMDTLSHELGHLIHFQLAVDDIPTFIKGTEFELGLATKEMVSVSKKMRPDLWDDSHYSTMNFTFKEINAERKILNNRLSEIVKEQSHIPWSGKSYITKLEKEYMRILNQRDKLNRKEIDMTKSKQNEMLQKTINYRMKDHELLADFIKGYLTNPKLTKELAPNMSKILKQMMNESWFKDILMLSKADILPPNNIDGGLLNTATV